MSTLKRIVPKFVKSSIKNALISNHRFLEKILSKYDLQTKKIIELTLSANSNWIDVGAHKGDIIKDLLRIAPNGKSFAFEPIPVLFKELQLKYGNKVSVHNIALSNKKGEQEFIYFKDRPAVSGLKERKFSKDYGKETILVKTEKLDNVIDADVAINLLKIDVEGAEMLVLQGGESLIKRHKPIILFEFGLGGAGIYGITPETIFDFMANCGLVISTLEYFIMKKEPLSREEFIGQYLKAYNFFFIAYPLDKKLK